MSLRIWRFWQQCFWRIEGVTAVLLKIWWHDCGVVEDLRLWQRFCWRFDDLTAVLLKIWSFNSDFAEDLMFWLRCCYRFEVVTAILLKIWYSDCGVAEDLRAWQRFCWRFDVLTAVLLKIWGCDRDFAEDLMIWLRCCWRFEVVTKILLKIWWSDCGVAVYSSLLWRSAVGWRTFSTIMLTSKYRKIFTSRHDITSLKTLILSTCLLGYLTTLLQRQHLSHNNDSDDIVVLHSVTMNLTVDVTGYLTVLSTLSQRGWQKLGGGK